MNGYRFSEIHTGLSDSFQVTVTQEMVDTFSNLTGDRHPIHSDRSFASNYGFPNKVVHGMLTASFYSTLVGMYLPGKYAFCHEAAISFTAPVYPGDTLTIVGKVVSMHEVYRQIEIKAQITNQHGQKVSRATIRTGINE